MDWSAVAFLFAERASLPAVLLNGRGEVLLIAPSAEQTLGWVERYVLPSSAASARWFIGRALLGALRDFEIEVLTGKGVARARFNVHSVGRGDDVGVLLVLEALVPSASEGALLDHDYEVQGIADGSFQLQTLWRLGTAAEKSVGTCFEKLHGRSAACERCPITRGEAGHRAGVTVDAKPPNYYVVRTSEALGSDGARVSVRRFSTASLAAVMLVRLDELAVRGRLTSRERSVFGYLIEGRDIDDIARSLGIGARTVKFHQANVLQKLGADSRNDLLRLVFWPNVELNESG
jgi:DNA-binding CsgD family transcriptional regulator